MGRTIISEDGRFEWDEEKNEDNIRYHGFSFLEILDLFNDPDFAEEYNVSHSLDEDRYVGYGKVNDTVIMVSFTLRATRTRIISSRKLRFFEQEVYNELFKQTRR